MTDEKQNIADMNANIGFGERLQDEEHGFTLPEMLTTIMIMIVVLFAIYSLFDTGIRIFSLSNDKIEAIESARFGLSRMEREARMAYPIYDEENESPSHIFFALSDRFTPYSPDSQRMTFGNDLNGNYRIDDSTEVISYYIKNVGDDVELIRNQDNTEQQVAMLGPTGEFRLSYWGNNDTLLCGAEADPSCSGVEENRIQAIQIKLVIDEGSPGDPRTQTLTTNVELRNRG